MNNHLEYVYPPDFAKANKHRLANRIFKGVDENTQEECQCCHRKIGSEQVETSCNIDPTQFSFLGPGVPLFFLFLRSIIMVLLIMAIIFMGFSIYSNIVSSDCTTSTSCIPDTFNLLSLVNKTSKLTFLSIQSYLSLVFVIAAILYFHYFRYRARQLEQECDQIIDSPSDYAVILRRLPKEISQQDIREMVETAKESLSDEQLKTCQNLQIVKIILSYSLRQYYQTIEANLQQFKKCIKEKKTDDFIPKQLPKLTQTSSIAIIVFEHQNSKNLIVHKPSLLQKFIQFFCTPCLPVSELQIKNVRISIERAPQPDDICWRNSGISMRGSICRKLGFGAIGVIILLIGGGAQYGLQLVAKSTSDATIKSIIQILTSLMVTIFNAVIMFSLVITTKKERSETLTEYQTVLMVKITIFQFFNAGIFVIGSEIAANYTTFSLNSGLCSQITMIMILNSIIPNVTLFFLSYSQLINRIFRFLVEKQIIIATQMELNDLFLGPQVDMPNKYAYILKTLWLTALYAPLIPIVVVISMVGIIINYFIQKILYTRSYSLPNTVSSMVFQSAVELLEYFLITFAFGEFIVYFYFYKYEIDAIPLEWTITIFITIALSILNSALPMETINESIFKIPESTHSNLKYSQIQQKFEVTYQMLNPAYKTSRQRKNVKDFMGLNHALGDSSKKAAVQMANLFDLAVVNNQKELNKQPLLSDLVSNNDSSRDLIAKTNLKEGFGLVKKRTMIEDTGPKSNGAKNSGLLSNDKKKPESKLAIVSDHSADKNENSQQNYELMVTQQGGNIQQLHGKAIQERKKEAEDNQINQNSQNIDRIKESSQDPQFQNASKKAQSNAKSIHPPSPSKPTASKKKKLQLKNTLEKDGRNDQRQQVSYLEPTKMQHSPKSASSPHAEKIHGSSIYANLGKPQHEEQKQEAPVRIFRGWPKPKRIRPEAEVQIRPSRFQMVTVNEVSEEKRQRMAEQKESRAVVDQASTPQGGELEQAKREQTFDPSKLSKRELHQVINEAYVDMFGKNSNLNSRSSLHQESDLARQREAEFKDPDKQKKATYDPLQLETSYKAFFNNSVQTQSGFLNRKVVMKFIGTPFSSFLLEGEKEESSPKKASPTRRGKLDNC